MSDPHPEAADLADTGLGDWTDHLKNLDWQARRVVFEAKAPANILTDVRERIRALLESSSE